MSLWLTLLHFDVFSTVHHSIGLFLHPTLMHNSITTCMSHYYPRHVSGLVPPEDGHVKARNMSRIVV